MRIYHGSDVVVKTPKILAANRLLDFGEGFYTTSNYEQAVRWAQRVSVRRNSGSQFITIYELDLEQAGKDLHVIEFKEADGKWLDFICTCRSGRNMETAYDMVLGPVADDNVYATVKLFETGVLDREETIKRLKVETLYDQILFHTAKSLDFCKYADVQQI